MDSESDFYGDDEEIYGLESRVATFDPTVYWEKHRPLTMTTIHIKAEEDESVPSLPAPPPQLHNPYEGQRWCAKQLDETTDVFLARLPPATTDVTLQRPWIFVANPFIPRVSSKSSRDEEAPAEFGMQLSKFMEGGEKRLEMLGDHQQGAKDIAAAAVKSFARGKGGPTKAALAKELAVERKRCVDDILMLARMLKVRSGKWMLFPDPADVNEVWGAVARATVKNELGHAAKVAPREEIGSTTARLICIYTYDFADKNDVARVLARLKQLGLVRTGPGSRQIYYKADAYTYLGIGSSNPWGLKASLYSSNEIFAHIPGMVGNAPAQKRKIEDEEDGRASQKAKVKREEDDDDAWTF